MSDAIEEIIRRIPSNELPIDPQTITSAVLERERTMATYLGNGLAVPHARLEAIDKPMLAVELGRACRRKGQQAGRPVFLLTPVALYRGRGIIASSLRSDTSPSGSATHEPPKP
jgi:tellurite resistance protein TerC